MGRCESVFTDFSFQWIIAKHKSLIDVGTFSMFEENLPGSVRIKVSYDV